MPQQTVGFTLVSFRKGVQCISGFRSSGIDNFCVQARVRIEFYSCVSVVGREIEGIANDCKVVGITGATSISDVLDQHRARGCSVALPQFHSVGIRRRLGNRECCQRL